MSKRMLVETGNAGDLNETIKLAERLNFKFIGTIKDDLRTLMILESKHEAVKRSSLNQTRDEEHLIQLALAELSINANITAIDREPMLERSKRDFIDLPLSDPNSTVEIPLAEPIEEVPNSRRMPRVAIPRTNRTKKEFGKYTEEDPMWPYLWYMNRNSFNKNLTDMNITNAWIQGYTGKGVSVTFLDDGLEWNHPDIIENYDPRASFDFNDHDDDPMPRYDFTNENKHGTRCAGEVAATGNNSICSIGIAYNAGIGGLRMLDGPITDSVEAMALAFNNDHVSIYSASWGPTDNGKKLEGPGRLVRQALKNGVEQGRGGLGSIFTWASGNGGVYGDSCACDGYVNSIYVMAISSTTDHGSKPWYLEECSGVLASTYSSGDKRRGQSSIATTDLRHKCTKSHTATSAAAPIAAGIIALTLEANKKLSWRDVMFIVALSARPNDKSKDFFKNAAGFYVSNRYGFGLMDAGRMVDMATTWKHVPKFIACKDKTSDLSRLTKENFLKNTTKIITTACNGTHHEVNYIEQVEAVVSLRTPTRGLMKLMLTSPSGTQSLILPKRSRDKSRSGIRRWAFKSLHFWGEQPHGEWKLHVLDFDSKKHTYVIDKFELVFHGTKQRPECYDDHLNNAINKSDW